MLQLMEQKELEVYTHTSVHTPVYHAVPHSQARGLLGPETMVGVAVAGVPHTIEVRLRMNFVACECESHM